MHVSFLLGVIASIGTFTIAVKNDEINYKSIKGNIVFLGAIIWLLLLCVTCFFSVNIIQSFKYLLLLTALMFYSFNFYNAFKFRTINEIIKPIVMVLIIATSLAIYDFLALRLGWTTFNKLPDYEKLVSGFLYFGNTADFAQLMLSLLIPFRIFIFTEKEKIKVSNYFIDVAILLGIILLIGTTRISVIISFFVSILISLILNRKEINLKKAVTFVFSLVIILVLYITLFSDIFKGILERINQRIISRKPNDLAGDFFYENTHKSLAIFKENPFFGFGLGQPKIEVNGAYYNVHGTFFKMLSETGIVGTIGYFIFLIAIAKFLYQRLKDSNNGNSFAYQFLPFLIGILISSVYNALFYRVEFWLFVGVFQILSLKLNSKAA